MFVLSIITQKNNGQGDGGILNRATKKLTEGYVKGCFLRIGKHKDVLGL